MTLEQLICPAVWEWLEANENLPKEQMTKEFDKWLVENEDLINKSVEDNIVSINECIERGKESSHLLMEMKSDDIDDDDFEDVDFDGGTLKDEDEPISGKVEKETVEIPIDEDEPDETISRKIVLKDPKKAKIDRENVFVAVNAIYDSMVKRNRNHKANTATWKKLDVSNVTDMTALLAFTDIPNADLSHWDVSKVKTMEGMFYKSTFNNDSIVGWKPKRCTNFLRMFTFSEFNHTLSSWPTGEIETLKLDDDGMPISDGKGGYVMTKTHARGPLIGAAEDEEAAMIQDFWDSKVDEWSLEESKNNKINNTMKHILDYETFINEGFGDFIKKGFEKVKKFFTNMAVKFNNFVLMFDKNGDIIDASSPYTALNFISDGKVQGVTAFSSVKNEYLNDNVQSTASIVESPEYYGIVDKDSVEYRNYLTMVDMINEHYTKYGDVLNENSSSPRVGFSVEGSGIQGIRDIKSDQLKRILNNAIKNVPGYKRKNAGGAVLIWGAPGIGKSTIPKAIINEWNDNHLDDRKSIMVVECGDLTVDGFSLPMPMKKKNSDYLKDHPEMQKKLIDQGLDITKKDFLDEEIVVSGEAVKTWLPVYKKTANSELNKIKDAIANGHCITEYNNDGDLETVETTEGGILLFDEFFRANEQIFKILMQILLNRSFSNGEYRLGSKWAIIACSNRPNDDEEVSKGFEKTGAVVGTRFCKQYNFVPDFDDWKKWAQSEGHFDDITIEFLMQETDPATGEYSNWHTVRPEEYDAGRTAWPTPRTWSMLMTELHNTMENEGYSSIEEMPNDIIEFEAAGAIGEKMAQEYVKFIDEHRQNGLKPAEMLNNPKYEIPGDMKVAEVLEKMKKYIFVKFDSDNLPEDEQMLNVFNKLESVLRPSHANLVKVFYISTLRQFGYGNQATSAIAQKSLPGYIMAIRKKYGLKTGDQVKEFMNSI